MGIAVADKAADAGADVTLILGPSLYSPENSLVKTVRVITAGEMAEECIKRFPDCDIAVLSAAVSDYTPEVVYDSKIKRKSGSLTITLNPTEDIAAQLGRIKRDNQLLVGFALETDNEESNAVAKLKRKNLDLIVLNSLRDEGAGFGTDTNRITLIDKYNNIDKFELKSKAEVAEDIIAGIISMIQ
jgi:phosphopantothenoylcysteine decarboxylase/phosphopantothenate--cysteine ligase